MKWAILALLITSTIVASGQNTKQPGLMLTSNSSTAGVTYTWYVGTAAGGEAQVPITCKAGVGNPNQCFWTSGIAAQTYYFTSVAWLLQGGMNFPSAPSSEVSLQFPTVPSAPQLSGALDVQ